LESSFNNVVAGSFVAEVVVAAVHTAAEEVAPYPAQDPKVEQVWIRKGKGAIWRNIQQMCSLLCSFVVA